MSIEAITIIFWLVALFASITVHEFLHAWTANYLGDPTAKAMGRVSLNPIAHIDLFGTIILPIMLLVITAGRGPVFGYAKPVQINPNNFKDYKKGQALTSIAGPVANLILAISFAAVYNFIPNASLFSWFLAIIVNINLILMVFNLLPVPPLDGSKVLYLFVSYETMNKIERYGLYLIPFIIFSAWRFISPVFLFFLNLLNVPLVV